MSKRKNYLVVDGYNAIFAWPELKKLSKSSLEHARIELKNILQNYARSHEYNKVILVFDNSKEKSLGSEVQVTEDFLVVYTKEHETADAYIERAVKELGAGSKFVTVEVVTSDNAEQTQVLGSGALRKSVRIFRDDVTTTNKETETIITTKKVTSRNAVGDHIQDEDIAKKLQALRLGKK